MSQVQQSIIVATGFIYAICLETKVWAACLSPSTPAVCPEDNSLYCDGTTFESCEKKFFTNVTCHACLFSNFAWSGGGDQGFVDSFLRGSTFHQMRSTGSPQYYFTGDLSNTIWIIDTSNLSGSSKWNGIFKNVSGWSEAIVYCDDSENNICVNWRDNFPFDDTNSELDNSPAPVCTGKRPCPMDCSQCSGSDSLCVTDLRQCPTNPPTSSPTSSPTQTRSNETTTDDRDSRTQELQVAQESATPVLLVLVLVVFILDAAVIAISKLICKDQGANYITFIQNSLALLDYISDIMILTTLAKSSFYDSYEGYFWVGFWALCCTSFFNVVVTIVILLSERKRKKATAAYFSEHRVALLVCILLSPLKANFVIILDCNLFANYATVFRAPLARKLRTKFRMAVWVNLLFEDVLQAVIVLAIQSELLGGWTTLNMLSFGVSLSAFLLSISVNSASLRSSYHRKKLKSRQKAIETGEQAQTEMI